MDDSEAERPNLKYSRHAAERKEERGISQSSVNAALRQGLQVGAEESNIYYDEDTTVVCSSRDNCIVTVNKNTRNTRFKLSERTTEKLKSLQFKADIELNNHAMCELAQLYLSGELGERDVKKAVELFKRAASKGNSHAMCKLSQIYERGYLGAPNQEEADEWMQRAADRNNVYALAIIGQRLLSEYLDKYPADSKIFKPSAPKEEIIFYFNKAVYKGSTRAMWHLGYIFEEGLLGEKDLTKAMEFYVKAAMLGSPTSLKSLHKLTLNCYFSAKELEEILEYIHPNLVKSSIGMAYELGAEQHSGDLGFNPVRGLKMLEQVALKQQTDAIELVALSYQNGRACRTNLKLAQYWFTKLAELYDESAKAGNLHSLWKLGECYANGIIGDFNLEKAEECFQMVVERSSSPGFMYKLGSKYLTGKLGDRPFETGVQLIARAIKLWESQAIQQIPTAVSNLGTVYCNIFCYKNGIHWLSKTPTDHVESQLLLVNMYVHHFCHENFLLGFEILKNLILEHDVDPMDAFEGSNYL
ncbi:uncharacterized protein [Bemisia tabaci]|uniref:uncharacterized protein n=1 Tax=Bemisia tabaci TaxID=7038 RepID=UPI003B2851FE